MNYTKSNYRTIPNAFGGIFEDLFQNGFQKMVRDDYANHNPAPVNIMETETAYEMTLSAPGLKKEDLKLSIEQDTMKISFEHPAMQEEETKGKWLRKEFKTRSFTRSFKLNEQINTQGISASYTDGILHISLPKKEQTQPVQHEITIA